MNFFLVSCLDEEFVKQEIEPMTEYAEEDKQYQTEGDEEIGTYESRSQENGKIRVKSNELRLQKERKKKNKKEQKGYSKYSF